MALSILDGNQSATTLSTILSSGQHITAHTVVSLGTQAITDMRGAVSGSVVSVSNLPSTQTIAGTVTANAGANVATAFYDGIVKWATNQGGDGSLPIYVGFTTSQILGGLQDGEGSTFGIDRDFPISGTVGIASLPSIPAGTNRIGVVTIGGGTVTIGAGTSQIGSVTASISGTVPISISSVTVGNSVTIGSLPAISGTVTANAFGQSVNGAGSFPIPIIGYDEDITSADSQNIVPVQINNSGGMIGSTNPLSISGTVTANSSSGSLTTRFGSVTTANTAFATSAVTNANRKYILIQNITTASNVITVGIGFTPTTTQGIQLFAGAGLTFEGSYIPTGAVNLLSSVTASCYTILEA